MHEIRAILFDVGGTLVEGAMPWYDLYQEALVRTARPMPARDMMRCYESAIDRMVADKQMMTSAEAVKLPRLSHYLADELGLSEGRLQVAVDEVLFDHPEARHLVCAAGARETLEVLRARGYRLGVMSNWSADLPLVLSRLELRHYFEAVFASESLGYAKPHAAAFLVPLDRLGLTPGESAYVGDLYHVDIVGSREVGMTPVLRDPLGLELHDDVITVARVAELLAVFPGT